MSHAITADAFEGAGIQEMRFDEIEEVSGGPIFVPPLVVAAAKFMAYATAAAGASAALTVGTAKVVEAVD